MKRVWVFAAAVLLTPAVAGAQAQFIPPPPPRGIAPPQRSQGITVNANANAKVAASSARVTLRLGSRTNAPIYNRTLLQPVIDAMVASGVDRNSIQLPLNFGAPGNSTFAMISGDVPHPSLESIESGVSTVGAAIVNIPGAILQDVQVTLRAQNCASAEAQARDTAIAQAREKAASIAKQIGANLGGVLSITANDQGSQDGTCTGSYSLSPYGSPVERNDYLTITVYSSVSITYGIR